MKKVVFIFSLIVLVSCNQNVSSDDLYKDFESNRWLPNQDIEFDLKVNDNEELWLHFSHIYNYDYNLLPIELELTNENYEKTFILVQLEVKDKEGNEKGDCLGDICDVYQKVNMQKLNSGNYHLVIRNKSDLPYLPNVIAVGYQLRKTTK